MWPLTDEQGEAPERRVICPGLRAGASTPGRPGLSLPALLHKPRATGEDSEVLEPCPRPRGWGSDCPGHAPYPGPWSWAVCPTLGPGAVGGKRAGEHPPGITERWHSAGAGGEGQLASAAWSRPGWLGSPRLWGSG